jgi:oligoribonuclease
MRDPERGGPSLLFCDVETGGPDPLDVRRGFLLEIGFRITDADLHTICEAAWPVPYRPATLDTIMAQTPASPVDVRGWHDKSGLWDDCSTDIGMSYEQANRYRLCGPAGIMLGQQITTWLHGAGADGLPLAGSSVHFDRRWLDHWLPGFRTIPSYRNVDVSTLKELLGRWRPDIMVGLPTQLKRHRSLPDMDDTIAELAWYRTALGLDVDLPA